MTNVLHLTRKLNSRPVASPVSGVTARSFRSEPDILSWLELRERAFAKETLGVRTWNAADFAREFLEKPWWRPEHFWIAETDRMVGSVTLAERATASESKPVVHWLLVDPKHRRQGIGQWLMASLEAAVWQSGRRQIWLETHAAWKSANALYHSRGYVVQTTAESLADQPSDW